MQNKPICTVLASRPGNLCLNARCSPWWSDAQYLTLPSLLTNQYSHKDIQAKGNISWPRPSSWLGPVSEGWVTPRSLIPKGGVTPPGVQWLPPNVQIQHPACFQTHFFMSCDQLWIAAGCPTRLVLFRGISKIVCDICNNMGCWRVSCREMWHRIIATVQIQCLDCILHQWISVTHSKFQCTTVIQKLTLIV